MDGEPLRVYGGITGDARQAERRATLIEAGLEILGTAEQEPRLTVRGVCKQAGLATRYFYESFDDRDALAVAVFDHVTSRIAANTLDAVESAPTDPAAKVRAGIGTIVREIAEDPRRGRLLFSPGISSPVLLHRRVESSRMFARLLGGQVREYYGITDNAHLELITEFLVGGLAQTLTSWLNESLFMTEKRLVEHCTELFLLLGEPGSATS